ncbi:cytochrome P450 [Streptomyces sp. LHD-70]|uniref:cytochrome P450 family protein n=1 Tax=Streptomyces sp. LHD-70 TaxID=3072140 RepID=UPI00280D0F76|nr:cytochrome P450 [Streptomyces sp. LHD-70]MDQ8705167.1 cytochrome P450 [Streptomyces sp. LHD-70]
MPAQPMPAQPMPAQPTPGQSTPAQPTEELAAWTEDFAVDPYSALRALRERGPVHYVRFPTGDTAWMILGHEEARAALADTRLRHDVRHSAEYDSDGLYSIGRNMLQTDPPDHTRLRSLVAREFTARRIKALRARIQEAADQLLDAMGPLGRADLIDTFAFPLPLTVICELLGVPGVDRDRFRAWTAKILTIGEPEASGLAAQEMTVYLAGLIEEKRRSAEDAEVGEVGEAADAPESDLLHALVRAHDEDGDRLTDEELLGMAFLLLVAGHETTVNLIANAVHLLLTHPDQLAALRADGDLLENALEEALRFEPPTPAGTYRYTAEPVTIAGTPIPQGARVVISLASANRDPERFPDPERFDIHRNPTLTRSHLAFGHGIHHCLGAPLARLEANLALRALLDRFPDLAIDGDPTPDWRPSLLRGLNRLPLRW